MTNLGTTLLGYLAKPSTIVIVIWGTALGCAIGDYYGNGFWPALVYSAVTTGYLLSDKAEPVARWVTLSVCAAAFVLTGHILALGIALVFGNIFARTSHQLRKS